MDRLVSLHGAYHPNNYGDVLILAIQANWIKEITGSSVVLPFATDIYRKTINSSPLLGLEGIKQSEKLIYGAGGYLGEPLESKWKWGFSFFKKHILPAEYAKKNNIEYAIIGPGVGPLTNMFTRYEVKRICNNSKIIVVRDEESKEYLLKYGISSNKINVTADVALSMENGDIPQNAVEVIESLLKDYDGLKYGIHVGVDKDSPLYGEKVKILFDECIAFLNNNLDITPVLIIDNDNIQQNKAVEYIESKVNRKCIIYKHIDIWETSSLLSKLDVVLTNKLHIGIVSYALGTIAVSFPYHPKTIRFYKQIEQEDLCIPILNIRTSDVYSILNKTLDKKWLREFNMRRDSIHPVLMEKALLNKKHLEEFLM